MEKLRALIFSDIHENIDNMLRLRELEDNVYDVVLIAGDVGSKIKSEFFSIIDSFECPSFCVYGNWDHDFEYGETLSNNCKLIHHNIYEVGGFFFTGFSGSPTSWGKNPIYLEMMAKVNEKHRNILAHLDEAQKIRERNLEKIDAIQHEKLNQLNKTSGDRRKTRYRNKKKSIYLAHNKKVEVEFRKFMKVFKSSDYNRYIEDSRGVTKKALQKNKGRLFDLIRNSKIPQSLLTIITHERVSKIAEHGVTPLLHVFGHVHKFKITKFKGANYLNPAAIDNGISLFTERAEELPVGYCSVEFFPGRINVERRHLYSTNL